MIKKWSYVAAAMLTAASGLALTSCIDNDEPYGIEQIRLATASLLEAKKSAVNAEQAAKEAELEIQKIWAEVEKMKVEKDRILAEADAKIKEAQAKEIELRAQAEAAKDQAEAERILALADQLKAQAEDQRAKTEMYLARQKAEIDELIAQAEVRVNKAQLEYETTLYYFEKEKAKNAEQANSDLYDAWATAFEAYINQLAYVNTLTEAYYKAVKDYARAEVDLIPNGDGWISLNYNALAGLKKAVKTAQEQIDNANEKIAKFQAIITDLQNATTSDLYGLFEKYETEAKENEAALAQAEADKAVLQVENKDLVQEINDLQAQKDLYNGQKIAIPAYTWNPEEIDKAAFASIGITDAVEIVPERDYYTLGDNFNEEALTPVVNPDDVPEINPLASHYTVAVYKYNTQINVLKNYLLDKNDVLWTTASINEMTNAVKTLKDNFKEIQDNWENAKKAYNMGNEPDFSVIPMEADVQAAVDALKEAVTSLTGLRQDYIDKYQAYVDAVKNASALQEAFDKDPNSAANKLQAALDADVAKRQENDATYNNALDAAQEAYDTTVTTALNKLKAAQRDEDAKYLIYSATLDANGGDETVQAVKDAKKAFEDAQTARGKAYTDWVNAGVKAQKDQTAANLKAQVAYINANKAAADALAAAKAAFEAAADDYTKDPAAQKWLIAEQEAEDAGDAMIDALNAMLNRASDESINSLYAELEAVCEKQSAKVGSWDYMEVLSEIDATLSDYLSLDKDNEEFTNDITENFITPAHYQVAGSYVNVKAYLINMSTEAYGALGTDYDSQNGSWDIDQAFLVDAADIDDLIKSYMEEKYPEMSEFNYPTQYQLLFGAYGEILYFENRIKVANAMLANQDLLSESIEPLKEGLAALEASKKTAEAELKEIENNLEDKQEEWDNLEADADAKVNNLKGWKSVYSELLAELTTIIADADENLNTEKDPVGDKLINKYIQDTIEKYENKIEKLQKLIAGEYQDNLDKANYQLQQYTDNEGVMTANPEQINLDIATANLATAQEYLAFLKARADELEAKYKASNK